MYAIMNKSSYVILSEWESVEEEKAVNVCGINSQSEKLARLVILQRADGISFFRLCVYFFNRFLSA